MNTYTIHDDPKVDAHIEHDLQCITAEICDTFSDVHAVILVGGFGRGEGTVRFTNGTPRPMNDYDLVVVTKHHHHKERECLEKLGRSLAKKLGIDFVDFGIISADGLRRVPPTIFNFELKHGSRVIFGPESVLDLVPNFQAEEIPSREGMILLMNRMGDILGRHDPFQNVKGLTDREREFISIPLHKALLACGDSLLLMHGLYDASYRRRLVALEELQRKGNLTFLSEDEASHIRFAYKEKLSPSEFVFENPTEVLTALLPMYREVFQRFASYALKTKCTTVQQAARCFMKQERVDKIYFKDRLKLLARTHPKQWRLRWAKRGLSRTAVIYASLPSLLFSSPWINSNEPSLLVFVLDLIEYLDGQKVGGCTELSQWNAAREVSFKLWKALFH